MNKNPDDEIKVFFEPSADKLRVTITIDSLDGKPLTLADVAQALDGIMEEIIGDMADMMGAGSVRH